MNLSRDVKFTRVNNAVAAATNDIESSGVDMRGYHGVAFLVAAGTVTGGAIAVKLQQSDDDGSSDAYSNLTGTSITVDAAKDNDVYILDVVNPRKRYVRCALEVGTQNFVLDGIFAMQYRADVTPVTQDSATVAGSEFHHAPAEGTA